MKFISQVLLVVAATAFHVFADYEVDVDLGTLPEGATEVSGTTALVVELGPPEVVTGGRNNADLIIGEGVDLNPEGNWGNEYVMQFSLAAPSSLTISKDVDFTVGDADFFLLEGLSTEFDGSLGKTVAQEGFWYNFFDEAAPVSGTVSLRAGTYYLVAESFAGFDGAVNKVDAEFSLRLNVLPALFPDEIKVNLGFVGVEGTPLTFDTFGSDFDTQLGIFSFNGSILQENDNAGDGLQSEVSFPDGLVAGTYIAVVAGAGATFELGPLTTAGGAVGNIVFNYPSNPNQGPGTATARTSEGTEVSETIWYEFTIASARPVESVDLGKIADPGVPIQIHTLESLIDTELAIYDEFGSVIYANDDVDGAAGVYQSLIDIPAGLTEGVWYAAVGGYDTLWGDGFEVTPGTASGAYSLTHPNGIVPTELQVGVVDWYRFVVGDPANGGGGNGGPRSDIEITSLTFDPGTNQFTVAWESSVPGPFLIEMGTAADLAAITREDNILPEVAAVGLETSPVTVPVPFNLLGEPKVFLRVMQE